MIVIIDRAGQLCNRLWAVTPFIAFSLEYNLKLYVINFDDYSDYFENINRLKNIRIGLFNNYYAYRSFIKLHKALNKIELLGRYVHYHEKFESYTEMKQHLIKSKTIHLINAWQQPRNINLLSKHKKQIRKLFSPEVDIKNHVDSVFDELKKSETVIIGIHIRRKDYRHYRNGKYYYEDMIYTNAMASLQQELKKKYKKTVFLLCSDEKINMNKYNQYNALKIEDPTPIHDLYALSKCDYIVGPPSTFSMWASFYGDVPLRFIHNQRDKIALSEFSAIIAQNRFKNGQRFKH